MMEDLNDGFETVSLGEQLRRLREAIGMSIEDVAREIKLSSRYVRALEAGDWGAFSARVYAQGATRRMARFFEGVDADTLAALCGREWDIAFGVAAKPDDPLRHGISRPATWFLTPQRLGALAAGGFGLLLTIFLSARLAVFAAPPTLVIREPADESGRASPIVDVAGRTEKESNLTVNGRELTIDEQGNFNEKIELPSGVAELHFVSRNRFGKTQTAVRTIFVE